MDRKLLYLFDYQRFENNSRLSVMISDTFGRYNFEGEGELADDDVGLLNAAGTVVSDSKTDGEKRL